MLVPEELRYRLFHDAKAIHSDLGTPFQNIVQLNTGDILNEKQGIKNLRKLIDIYEKNLDQLYMSWVN